MDFEYFMENRAASMPFTAYQNNYLRKVSSIRCQSERSYSME